jgi:hypothetical protein
MELGARAAARLHSQVCGGVFLSVQEAAHGAIIAALPLPLNVLTAVSAPVVLSVLESTDYWFCSAAINVSLGQRSPIL